MTRSDTRYAGCRSKDPMPTPSQLRTIHSGARRVGLTDPAYRVLLRNVGGVESSKDLDNPGIEDVMAVLEDLGFTGHPGGDHYWRDKVRTRGSECGARMARKIRELAAGGRYALEAMVERFSDGRTAVPEKLHPREGWKLIEGLKAIQQREEAGKRTPAATDAPGHDAPNGGTDAASLFDQTTEHAGAAEVEPRMARMGTDEEVPF